MNRPTSELEFNRRYPLAQNGSRGAFHYQINQRMLDIMVVTVGIGLPPFLATASLFGSCMRSSVSHFYYEPFYGDIFVGAMFFIGIFLLIYRGQSKVENTLAKLAALGAIGTALFPVRGSGCDEVAYASQLYAVVSQQGGAIIFAPMIGESQSGFFQLSEYSHLLHTVFAAMMSAFLAYYAVCVLGRIRPDGDLDIWGRVSRAKRLEIFFYRFCAVAIVLAILLMAGHVVAKDLTGQGIPYWDEFNGSFLAESIAIEAFGLSWLLHKGLLRRKKKPNVIPVPNDQLIEQMARFSSNEIVELRHKINALDRPDGTCGSPVRTHDLV